MPRASRAPASPTTGWGAAASSRPWRRRAWPARRIEAGLEAALGEVSEQDGLDTLARRYWRTHTRDEPARRVKKLWAFLCRRGFPPALVHERLSVLWPRWREALEGLELDEG